ncbi:MAG: hypothetical protein ABIL09_08040 [Gemmatimonadota bacterium]
MNEPRERTAVTDSQGNRAMPPPAESWQWAFQYLREDNQELRAEMRELRRELMAEIRGTRNWTLTSMLALGGILAALIKL